MTIDDLIAALERAEGPSRELDEAIALAVGWTLHTPHGGIWWKRPGGEWALGPDMFTASIDAALTLVADGASWTVSGWRGVDGNNYARARLDDHEDPQETRMVATPAIALCIASLRARKA